MLTPGQMVRLAHHEPGVRYDLEFDELKRDRLILGSPAEVVEQVMSYHEEFGAAVVYG